MSRSFLFVPADSERKLAKAGSAGADALILDLEDAVAPAAKPQARQLAADYLRGKADIWVRVNPVDSEYWEADLDAVIPVLARTGACASWSFPRRRPVSCCPSRAMRGTR